VLATSRDAGKYIALRGNDADDLVIDTGRITVFQFDEIVQAHRFTEENRATGKLLIVVHA
jgi:hypothetical protein